MVDTNWASYRAAVAQIVQGQQDNSVELVQDCNLEASILEGTRAASMDKPAGLSLVGRLVVSILGHKQVIASR